MAHANGKVLLFGEHAVVHGVPALAASLPNGVVVQAVRDARTARIRVPAWGLDVALDSEHLVARALRQLVGALRGELAIEMPALDVTLDASIPPGAGLGSSAALAVAYARLLVERDVCAADDGAIFDAALAAERVFHGNPSGLDHFVAMRDGVFRFVRGAPPFTRRLPVVGTPVIVIAHVAPGASTAKMVGGVAQRLNDRPTSTTPILRAIDGVVAEASDALATGDLTSIGRCMDSNHYLLAALGVSTPALDAGCHLARALGALGAKLTGAGGGGCIIALAADDGEQLVTRLSSHFPWVHALALMPR